MFFVSKEKRKAAWVQTALERYERPLLQYAMSIVQDLDRARDIVQDTFMRLHNQEQEAIEGHLSQWLFTVCRNCSLKSLKKEDRYILNAAMRNLRSKMERDEKDEKIIYLTKTAAAS